MKKMNFALRCALVVVMVVAFGVGLFVWSGNVLVQWLHLDVVPDWRFALDLALYGSGKAQKMGKLAIGVSVAMPLLVLVGLGVAGLLPKRRLLYGDSRLATVQQLAEAGLFTPDSPDDKYPSLVVGKVGKRFLLWRGQQFLFLAAPTRSGKGVGIVIPNLLHYSGSVIVLDIKGENFEMTAGFRHHCGQEVHRFSPDNENCESAGWNPLDYIRENPLFRLGDLSRIATSLYPVIDGDVWSANAQKAFIGVVLYMMETGKWRDKLNLATVAKLPDILPCFADEESFKTHVESRKSFEPLSDECIEHLIGFVKTGDKQRASIMISYNAPLGVYADPITALATKKSTFDLREVRRKRMSIYVVICPANLERFERLLNLFVEQAVNLNMQALPEVDATLKYQCLFLLDEFPAAGRLGIVQKSVGYTAGYNMRFLIIAQSRSQLQDPKLYGDHGARTMLTNMAMQVCFAPKDQQDARDYSEMLGTGTVKGRSISRGIGWFTQRSGPSESISDQSRPVLNPDEVKGIGQNKQLLALENVPTALVDKIRWYEEDVFKARAYMPVPAVLSSLPSTNVIERSVMVRHDAFAGADTARVLAAGVRYQVGFSPKRGALDVVLGMIKEAKTELLVAAYSMTHQSIAFALVEARNRGVAVRVVVDFGQNGDDQAGYKAVEFLEAQKIPLIRTANYSAMHHKFIVADARHVQFGSFNYTPSADRRNAESAFALYDAPDVAALYSAEFERLFTEPTVRVENIMQIDDGLAVLAEFGL